MGLIHMLKESVKEENEIEYKEITFEGFKFSKASDDDDAAGFIEGFASTFGNVDKVNDMVMEGAFKKSLHRMRRNKKQIPMLMGHDTRTPIGVFTSAKEIKGEGLFVEGRISKTTIGNDAATLVKDKVIDSMSIGFMINEFEFDVKKNIRKLTEIDLMEISLVTFPANEKATITAVKDFVEGINGITALEAAIINNTINTYLKRQDESERTRAFDCIREFEHFLRDVGGCSIKEARRLASGGYKNLEDLRDVEKLDVVMSEMTNLQNIIRGIKNV